MAMPVPRRVVEWTQKIARKGISQAHDEPAMRRSHNTTTKLLTDEIATGIPSSQIVLGGFSQGDTHASLHRDRLRSRDEDASSVYQNRCLRIMIPLLDNG